MPFKLKLIDDVDPQDIAKILGLSEEREQEIEEPFNEVCENYFEKNGSLKDALEGIANIAETVEELVMLSNFLGLAMGMEDDEETSNTSIPAIPPDDYKGTQACWMSSLQSRGLWDGQGWHGDVEITVGQYNEILDECEN